MPYRTTYKRRRRAVLAFWHTGTVILIAAYICAFAWMYGHHN